MDIRKIMWLVCITLTSINADFDIINYLRNIDEMNCENVMQTFERPKKLKGPKRRIVIMDITDY